VPTSSPPRTLRGRVPGRTTPYSYRGSRSVPLRKLPRATPIKPPPGNSNRKLRNGGLKIRLVFGVLKERVGKEAGAMADG